MWRVDPAQVALAVALDLLLGDPRGWPHIARGAGWLSNGYELLLTRWFRRSVPLGFIFWLLVTGTMIGIYSAIYQLCSMLHPVAGWLWQAFIIYQAIAAVDLARHAQAVLVPLSLGDLSGAREKLARIVGRDTANLDVSEISRGAIESVAESTNDAIIAPLFWSFVAGAPGALVYRTANTLDSMVGHRSEKYERFGKVSARVDDVLNWIPARAAALIFCLLNRAVLWRTVRREAAAHGSPNAGWGEAAMAYALNVRLGGDNSYSGERVAGVVFHADARPPCPDDVAASLTWMWRVSAVFAVTFLLTSYLLRFLFHL